MNAPADHESVLQRNAENRGWARSLLEVPADVAAGQEEAIILARLEAAEFVPPPPWEQAILLLAAESPHELYAREQGAELLRPYELSLKEEVDRLAEAFFALPVAERHTRWRTLTERCAFSLPLSARLEALLDGLDVVPPPAETKLSPAASGLVKQLCQAFVLPPSERAARHEQMMLRAAAQPSRWQSAAWEIRKRYPQIVPLASLRIGTLSNYVRVQKVAAKAAAKQRAVAARATNRRAKGVRVPWQILLPLLVVGGQLSSLLHSPSSSPPRFYSPPMASPSAMPALVPPPLEAELLQAQRRGILPPRDPQASPGKSLNEGNLYFGEAARRMLAIPDNVDVFREDGKLVFRQKAVVPPLTEPEPLPPQRTNPPR